MKLTEHEKLMRLALVKLVMPILEATGVVADVDHEEIAERIFLELKDTLYSDAALLTRVEELQQWQTESGIREAALRDTIYSKEKVIETLEQQKIGVEFQLNQSESKLSQLTKIIDTHVLAESNAIKKIEELEAENKALKESKDLVAAFGARMIELYADDVTDKEHVLNFAVRKLTSQAQEIERLKEDVEKRNKFIDKLGEQDAAKDRELSELRKLKFEAEGRANEKSNFFELEKARSKKLTDQNRVLREALEEARPWLVELFTESELKHYTLPVFAEKKIRNAFLNHQIVKKIDAALSQVTTPAPEAKTE